MSQAIVETKGLTKRYGQTAALDGIDLRIGENQICGLLGRNGAGKTTLMHIITSQLFATSGELHVFGEKPYENEKVLRQMCFIKESQAYAKTFKVADVVSLSNGIFPNWDSAYAERLLNEFELPRSCSVGKLSRGMLSSLGIVVGLASRAPLTIFDEPYLGLDAASRTLFYDLLLEDYSNHPRTIILSTHLIDEVSRLLEHVVIIDHGRILLDQDADEFRGMAYTVTGNADRIRSFAEGKKVLHEEGFGSLLSVVLWGRAGAQEKRDAAELGLELGPVSFQQLFVHMTSGNAARPSLVQEGAIHR
ncbi:ABC transporter ATP-binding protein [Gorillibacterium timonense]|uniref:ABC transporter ATP-binding protein n=1 Tax=Gorillibacterium timonense TaxID=1689269 RepID=UPI00071C525B|nr:ABC transporter ATP-binding protein [Gorillibacterium timonense]